MRSPRIQPIGCRPLRGVWISAMNAHTVQQCSMLGTPKHIAAETRAVTPRRRAPKHSCVCTCPIPDGYETRIYPLTARTRLPLQCCAAHRFGLWLFGSHGPLVVGPCRPASRNAVSPTVPHRHISLNDKGGSSFFESPPSRALGPRVIARIVCDNRCENTNLIQTDPAEGQRGVCEHLRRRRSTQLKPTPLIRTTSCATEPAQPECTPGIRCDGPTRTDHHVHQRLGSCRTRRRLGHLDRGCC